MTSERSLLDLTLGAARRDQQTVTSGGDPIGRLTEGVQIRNLAAHIDPRGSVIELFDPKWHPDPMVYAYCFTLRPGFVKGWNLHREHEDRYAVLQGEMELVLYDPRADSSTCGEVCRIVMAQHKRCLVNVPAYVWHADYNIGSTDVVVINFPTKAYDHENPDKYRLPIDTPLIPHSFPGAKGW